MITATSTSMPEWLFQVSLTLTCLLFCIYTKPQLSMSSLVNPRKQAIGMLDTRRQRSFSKSTLVKSRSKSLVVFERITFYLQVPFLLLLP